MGNYSFTELNLESVYTPILSFLIFAFVLGTMLYLHLKYENSLLFVLAGFMFDLIFSMISIQNFSLPFSPYTQIFFIIFGFLILILNAIEFYQGG